MSKEKQTKLSKVETMLRRPDGASLDDLCQATGWQPHSARAALSGLRRKGAVIERRAPTEKGAPSIYRITAASGTAE